MSIRRVLPWLAVFAVGCSGGSTPPPIANAPSPSVDPSQSANLDQPLTGTLRGLPFTPDRVEIDGNWLTIRQGADFFADLEIKIPFKSTVKLDNGYKITVKPDSDWAEHHPTLHVSTRTGKQMPKTDFVSEKYSFHLELEPAVKGQAAGRLSLNLGDATQSQMSGRFTAIRIRPLSEPAGPHEVPYIQGVIVPKSAKNERFQVGYVGMLPNGEVISDSCGNSAFENGTGGVRSTTFKPRAASLWFVQFEPHFDFSHLPPGRYFIYAQRDAGLCAWSWHDVKSNTGTTQVFTLDPKQAGTVHVKVPAGPREVQLHPFIPEESDKPQAFRNQLTSSLRRVEKIEKQEAAFFKVMAGQYRVKADQLEETIEVKAGQETRVELKPKK
jgi:hypothetical protein